MPIPPLPYWRTLIFTAPVATGSTVAAFSYPEVTVLSIASELLIANMIILTAVFGSDRLSERAFRLLRWAVGASEPDRPRSIERS